MNNTIQFLGMIFIIPIFFKRIEELIRIFINRIPSFKIMKSP